MKITKLSALLLLIVAPVAVIASSSDDRKIEQAARASYNFRMVLEDHVTVKADDGVVTLTGTVQDDDEKTLAGDTVDNLPGVIHVRNHLTVTSTQPEHSDGWIALKIRSQLLVKANVSATSTKVAVQDGAVTLNGTADNAAQKALTEMYVREVDGVKSVKNDLVVNALPASTQTIGEKIDDASITTQVKFAVLRQKSTHVIATKVTTRDGNVVIVGTATSDAEKAIVTKLAEGVRGVNSVRNDMSVKS